MMGPKLLMELIVPATILLGLTLPIIFISPVLAHGHAMAAAKLDTDTQSIPECAARRIDNLYQTEPKPICFPPRTPPPMPPMSESNCLISPYTVTWTGLKFFLMTVLIFALPLPTYLYLKRRLSQADSIAHRILWGIFLFFLIACVTIYVTELEGNRKQILGNLVNATGNRNQCDFLRETADFEIMNIFLHVNPLNSILKTVQVLMDGMARGRQRSRVTKLYEDLILVVDAEEELHADFLIVH